MSTNNKKPVNEGLFSAAKRFSDAFFDGLQKNAVDRVISKAQQAQVDPEVIKTMERIKHEKKELDRLLGL